MSNYQPQQITYRHGKFVESEGLIEFIHPPHAVYVFGPEDGSIPVQARRHCWRFVRIPTYHCLNLATAVGTVLYDRMAKFGCVSDAAFPTPS
jgi:tRNA(Leu) C34 or U34 (ribose-2'-O)-methylase TrmL